MNDRDISEIAPGRDERIDELLRNGYRIIQNTKMFCFGMDAVLLSGFVKAGENDRLMDLCTGNGVIPILLRAKTKCRQFVGVEIQEESVDLAKRSVLLNGLSESINIVNADIRQISKLYGPGSFSVVTANPPYMNENNGLISPSSQKAIARHEIMCTLKDVVEASSYLLPEGGTFFMVHRPNRLPDIIDTMRKSKIEPKRMRLVYPYVDKEPNMVLIEGSKNGNPFLKVEAPLVVFKEPGIYTDEVAGLYGNEETHKENI